VKCMTRKLRSPLKWHGGKSYLARRIIALMPEHRVYVEPFLGGGSVLLNKRPAESEVAGDINPAVINLWEVLRARPFGLTRALDRIPYTRESWEEWTDPAKVGEDPVDRAVAFMVTNRFSRGGLGADFAWSERLRGRKRMGGPVPGDVNAWDTIRSELPAVAERVRGVEFYNRDARELIREHDAPDTLFYCDPPYLKSTRKLTDAYTSELDDGRHYDFLYQLRECHGHVMISGYRCDLYDELLCRWGRVDFDMPNHSGQSKVKQRRVECLWIKPAAGAHLPVPEDGSCTTGGAS
jgi:DNA adenine methylase